ncbi:MAG: hypothetical protein Ct9H300mP32_6500 [Verrucomicrobiota bacterium]|nr:MAG: hypothetical protein Ct9H300mP32_6500 [Verrucomicrobiota bacterium]
MLCPRGRDEGDLGLLFPCSPAIILLTTAFVFLTPKPKSHPRAGPARPWRLLIADRKFLRFLL